MQLRRKTTAALAVLGLILGSCGGSGDDVPSATVPTVAPTTTPADPFAVPEVIDEAYVNKVLAALDAAVGDVVRLVVRERAVTPEAITRLEAIYVDEALRHLVIKNFELDVNSGLKAYRISPTNPETSLVKMVTRNPECLFVEVARDYSGLSTEISKPQKLWLGLRRTTHADSATHWGLFYDGFQPDFSSPSDPCAT